MKFEPVQVPDERSRVNVEERVLGLGTIGTKHELTILTDRQALQLSLHLWQLLQELVVLHSEENEVGSKGDCDDVTGHVMRHQPVGKPLSAVVGNFVGQEDDRIFANVLEAVDLPEAGGADGERRIAVKGQNVFGSEGESLDVAEESHPDDADMNAFVEIPDPNRSVFSSTDLKPVEKNKNKNFSSEGYV